MPFPCDVDGSSYATPQQLAAAVLTRARAGEQPERGLFAARQSESLSRDEAVGLCAALVQTGQPAAVATGARLAESLGDPALGPLLLLAHEALDVGTLLAVTVDGSSVEDCVLRAAAHLLPADHPRRVDLLGLLRNAGLTAAEIKLLARSATADELSRDLSAALIEGLPEGTAGALAQAARRSEAHADAVRAASARLSPEEQVVLLTALRRAGVAP